VNSQQMSASLTKTYLTNGKKTKLSLRAERGISTPQQDLWVIGMLRFAQHDNPTYAISPRWRRCVALAAVALLMCSVAAVGQAEFATKAPTVTFDFSFPGSVPESYSIKVSETGESTYESTGKIAMDSEAQSDFSYEFSVSDAARKKVFDLARRANFFDGDFDYKKGKLASTGEKTLGYVDAERNNRTTYNYSSNQVVQQLTQFFQGLSATLEFGRRLQYCHRYQRLALEAEMKRMEEMNKGNGLEEIQAVSDILQKIATDQTVLNVTRVRAQRLLAGAGLRAGN